MLKKMLCAMLSLMLLACIFPLTGLAGEEQVLHTVNMLRFPAALTQIGDQGTSSYLYEDEEVKRNDDLASADYIPQDRTIVGGDVGYSDDKDDYYKLTLDQSCFLDFFGVSGIDGQNTTRFRLLDEAGGELLTAAYEGATNTDDYFSFTTTLPAGTYYICVSDNDNWVLYYYAFILTPALDAPVVSADVEETTGKPVLRWNAVAGASGYQVFRAESGTGDFRQLLTTEAVTLTDTTAEVGKIYDYKVVAVSAEELVKDSGYSAQVSAACTLVSPAVSISVNTATGKPVVKWETVEGAAKYYVYRSTKKTSGYERVYTGVTARSYTDNTAEAGTNYYYKVKAIHESSAGNSPYSAVVNRVCDLAKPTVSITGNTGTGKPVVKWETVEGAAKYYVYRSTKETSGFEKVYTGVTARSYTDKTAEAGTNYYYKVKAIHEDSSANSADSRVVNRVCDLKQPVMTLKVDTASGKPKVTFGEVSGAQKYYIVRSTDRNGTYSKLATITGTSYIDTTAKAGTNYYYKVKALHSKDAADSAYSEIDNRVCDLAKPVVSIKLSGGDPRITWDKIDGAQKYYIYRATSKSGEYTHVKTTVTASSFTDTDVTSGKTYYYKVMAIHAEPSANSAYSAVKSITAK